MKKSLLFPLLLVTDQQRQSKQENFCLELCLKFEDKCLIMISNKAAIESKLNKEVAAMVKPYSDAILSSRKKITYTDFLSDKMLLIRVIRQGISYSFFKLIQSNTPFSEDEWAIFLDINLKTLQRYKQANKVFKSSQSEKIIEMAEVTNIGLDVFGEMEKFKLWLDTPSFALGNLAPMELLRDSYGKEMVIGELIRINHGILV